MKEATEIKELDMNKYLVLKWDDIKKLNWVKQDHLNEIIRRYNLQRELEGKQDNKYLVLNLDDEIDLESLVINASIFYEQDMVKVSDIALALANAIQKAKEKP